MGQRYRSIFCALVLTFVASSKLAAQVQEDPFSSVIERRSPEAGAPAAHAAATGTTPADAFAGAKKRIQKVLAAPLRESMDFTAQPLSDVVTILEETYDIPIEFDTAALDAVAASPDVEVTVQINNVTLGSALNLMLRNSGAEELTYIIDNEVLLITTEEEAQSHLETKVYRVDHLRPLRGRDPAGASAWADFDGLIDLIVSCVEPESWAENSTGEGEISPHGEDILVIMQTSRVHEQIKRLLTELADSHEEVKAAAGESVADGPITRGISILGEPFTGSNSDRQKVRDLIMRSVDWQPTGELTEDDIFFEIIAGRMYVRHTPEVVQQIEDVARAMQLVPTGGAGFGGGFGGIGGFGAPPTSKARSKAAESKPEGESKGPAIGTGVF